MPCIKQNERDFRYPCGKCILCRDQRVQERVSRLQLERYDHDQAVFVTCTYAPEHLVFVPERLPPVDDDDQGRLTGRQLATLCKADAQNYLKRVRHHFDKVGRKLRYDMCGEYGKRGVNPHYHFILFGAGVQDEHLLVSLWDKGFVSVQELDTGHLSYVAKHNQRMSYKDQEGETLRGRVPEYELGSRKPAIGVPFIERLAKQYEFEQGAYARYLALVGDIMPFYLQAVVVSNWDGKRRVYFKRRLNYFMKTKLREALGLPITEQERDDVDEVSKDEILGSRCITDEELERMADRKAAKLRQSGIIQ